MARETRRLTTGELVAGVCAILLVLDLFLHWYSLEAARALLRGQQRDRASTPPWA